MQKFCQFSIHYNLIVRLSDVTAETARGGQGMIDKKVRKKTGNRITLAVSAKSWMDQAKPLFDATNNKCSTKEKF